MAQAVAANKARRLSSLLLGTNVYSNGKGTGTALGVALAYGLLSFSAPKGRLIVNADRIEATYVKRVFSAKFRPAQFLDVNIKNCQPFDGLIGI
jgi:hypothetical protein